MEIDEYLLEFIGIIREMEMLDLFSSEASSLNKTEFRLVREVLHETEKGRKIISSELARRLGITRSAVSQIVNRLEERDIVKRMPAPDDLKIAYIVLSDRSIAVYNEQCRQANAIMAETVSRMGEENVQALLSGYREFLTVFTEARDRLAGKKSN